MSFVRAKEIPPKSGNWYDYEVETLHIGGKVIQQQFKQDHDLDMGEEKLAEKMADILKFWVSKQ